MSEVQSDTEQAPAVPPDWVNLLRHAAACCNTAGGNNSPRFLKPHPSACCKFLHGPRPHRTRTSGSSVCTAASTRWVRLDCRGSPTRCADFGTIWMLAPWGKGMMQTQTGPFWVTNPVRPPEEVVRGHGQGQNLVLRHAANPPPEAPGIPVLRHAAAAGA